MFINSILKYRVKKVHFVGIGGIGMSGIARILLAEGFVVSGSDVSENAQVLSLKNLGAEIFLGHNENNINNVDVLVCSSAISSDNPELLFAKKNGIPIIPRAMMLAEIMRLRCGIAISGAHGKTTTTSMISYIMHKLGIDPTVVIGGVVNQFGTNALLGKSQFMVAEADESDGSFLHLTPSIAVVTNIDAEHLDYYQGGLKEIIERFANFLNSVPFYGLVVACIDDENVKKALAQVNRRVVTYGLTSESDYFAENIEYKNLYASYDLYCEKELVGRVKISLTGKHNVLNSLASIAVLRELGVSFDDIFAIIEAFKGVKRRFSLLSESDNYHLVDDYAHHPTEIATVISAAKTCFVDKKIRVLFQPHRFSRVRDLMKEFSECFKDCDSLIVTDIFPASEAPIDGINSKKLAEKIKSSSCSDSHYGGNIDECVEKICSFVQKGDVVLTLGAGTVGSAAIKLNKLLIEKYD